MRNPVFGARNQVDLILPCFSDIQAKANSPDPGQTAPV